MQRGYLCGGGVLFLLVVLIACMPAAADGFPNPRAGWSFDFQDFVISAWSPPAPTDAEYAVYRRAGFNLVMSPRYEGLSDALMAAGRHELWVILDTYTPNDRPWGGNAASYTPHPSHHPATLPELKWLHRLYGEDPALAGYLLGDDQGALPPEMIEVTEWMHTHTPHLIPWICQNDMSPASLARNRNPFFNPQIYPTLYNANASAIDQCRALCADYERLKTGSQLYKLVMWPMFNVDGVESDSITRFQVNSAIAYGAQGLWYFTYANGLQKGTGGKTEEEVKASLRPIWAAAAETNNKVAQWGSRLLGRQCAAVYATGWELFNSIEPGKGRLIEEMSDDLIAGVLTTPGEPPLVMIVDKRVDKAFQALPPQNCRIQFSDAVHGIEIIQADHNDPIRTNILELQLPAGGGQLVALHGPGFDKMQRPMTGLGIMQNPILIKKNHPDADGFSIQIKNPSELPFAIRGEFEKHSDFRVKQRRWNETLAPKSETLIRFEMKNGIKAETGEYVQPLILDYEFVYQLPGGKEICAEGPQKLWINAMDRCPVQRRQVSVDGSLFEWGELPFICKEPSVLKINPQTWLGSDDCSFRFAVTHDTEFVYIGIDVLDDELVRKEGRLPWEQDGLEIRLDARPDPWRSNGRGGGERSEMIFAAMCPGTSLEDMFFYGKEYMPEGLQAACVMTHSGFAAEMAIPCAYLDTMQGDEWSEFRLNIAVSDFDEQTANQPGGVQIWWRPDWRMQENKPGSGTFYRD